MKMSVRRWRGVPLIAGVALALLSGCGKSGPPRPTRHVLLITLDTTRADRLGTYGCKLPTTPVLDALAKESVVFDLAIAQAAVTPVSHASIMTGLIPPHHGLRVLHGLVANRLAQEQTTLAEVWLQAGGATAAFVSAFPASAAFGLDQGFEHFDAEFPQADGAGLINQMGVVSTGLSQRRAMETTDRAIAWLRDAAGGHRPVLLWVHYFDPHDALLLPPPGTMRALQEQFPAASAEGPDQMRATYAAEVNYMDHQIGRLLRTLRDLGMWEKTIVVVVADHGEGLGDHDWWVHGILYQEQIRVPLIVRIPGIPGGKRIAPLVRTIDIMPTVLAAAEVAPGLWPQMDGISLLDAVRTGNLTQKLLAYSESVNMLSYQRPYQPLRWDRKVDKLYTLMSATGKLIYHQIRPEETEYYDLVADPLELKNLAAETPPEMLELRRQLEGMNVFSDIMPRMSPTDYERTERLRSLGYIQ